MSFRPRRETPRCGACDPCLTSQSKRGWMLPGTSPIARRVMIRPRPCGSITIAEQGRPTLENFGESLRYDEEHGQNVRPLSERADHLALQNSEMRSKFVDAKETNRALGHVVAGMRQIISESKLSAHDKGDLLSHLDEWPKHFAKAVKMSQGVG
jgi:hypothetical protein